MANDEDILILSEAKENTKRIEKNAPHLADFARVTKRPVLAITKEELNLDIPTMKERELRKMDGRDLVKFLKKW
jgi:hypothetical protein